VAVELTVVLNMTPCSLADVTDISKEHCAASIFGIENTETRFFRNFGLHLPDDTASHPDRNHHPSINALTPRDRHPVSYTRYVIFGTSHCSVFSFLCSSCVDVQVHDISRSPAVVQIRVLFDNFAFIEQIKCCILTWS
jgi:hypothetical protein